MREILNFVHMLGNTSINVYEWREADIRMKRLPNAPDFKILATQQPSMTFNGWSLAHAVVKADYLDRRNLVMPGIGFLLQASNLIDFGSTNIELKPSASKALNDFSLTSLSGRVGQGLTILYGQTLGLKFTAHLRSHVESLPPGSPGIAHIREPMADFLFADNKKTVLFESKGTFKLENNDPTAIKSVLRPALFKQIDPWIKYLNPTPDNGYVVYSCLREKSWQPSALFIVDPAGEDGQESKIPFSLDQVLRENYGAWLRAMGLNGAANRLLQSSAERQQPIEELFIIQEFGGRPYAFLERNYSRYYRFHPTPAMGIDLAVLRAISSIIQTLNVSSQELLINLPEGTAASQDAFSIFPDGSIFTSINLNRSGSQTILI